MSSDRETVDRERAPAGTASEDAADSFDNLAAEVDRAMAAVDGLDEEPRLAARALQQAIESFHRPALVHIVRRLKDDPRGKELLFELVDDPSVRAIFSLHGIIKQDPLTRARKALEGVRPYLQSHGGDVELVRVAQSAAYVRLQGACSGCSMSAVTLRDGVEEALVGVIPEIERIEVLEDQPTSAIIPLSSLGEGGQHGWTRGPESSAVPPGGMLRFDLEAGDEQVSFLITNVENRIAVFRNACAHMGLPLDGGTLQQGILTCPWHQFRFDAATGECVSSPGAQLEAIPARVEQGHVWIRTDGA